MNPFISHLSSKETGIEALQEARCFLSCSGGRNLITLSPPPSESAVVSSWLDPLRIFWEALPEQSITNSIGQEPEQADHEG